MNATSSKIKIHFDVTVRNFFSIVAAVCRNDFVDVTFAHTSLMPHTDLLIREVNVTLLALKFAAHHNLSFVLFEGNSKPMRTRMDGFMSITSSSSRVETNHLDRLGVMPSLMSSIDNLQSLSPVVLYTYWKLCPLFLIL